MKVLVVERDSNLARLIERSLVEHGVDVEISSRGDQALQLATERGYDAIVMDRTLPGMDGPDICQRLRDRGVVTHVIMLSSQATIDDRVSGLDSGADDYMAKPFALRELHARLRAVQRKGRSAAHPPADRVVCVDELELDWELERVRHAGVEIKLRPKEFAVLALLMRHPGRVVTRWEILEAAWPGEPELRSNVLDVTIRRLRRRIDEPYGTTRLQTVRGRGYRLVARAARAAEPSTSARSSS